VDAGSLLGSVLRAGAELVLPGRCGGCGENGAPLCDRCRAGVRAASGAAFRVPSIHPARPGHPVVACWAGAVLEEPLRAVVSAYKDAGRRDLAGLLVAPLVAAIDAALTTDGVLRQRFRDGPPILVVPAPSSRRARRRRGDDPVGGLAGAAVRVVGPGLIRMRSLRHCRRVSDQSGLDRLERARNLNEALIVVRRDRDAVRAAVCLVVDDVVTTGATVQEAARALRASGAAHVVAAAAAATPHRGTRLVGPQQRH
jgi:predicted amidophosphoribosyltransferase